MSEDSGAHALDLTPPPSDLVDREAALKLEQIELQRDIIALRKEQLTSGKPSNSHKISPVVTTVLVAVFGLLGTALGALAQGWFNRQLERDKFEFTKQIESEKNITNLVLKAVETGDPEKAKTNLLFLVKAGFIQDPQGRISALANNPATVPVLPKPSTSDNSSREPVRTPATVTFPNGQSYRVGSGEVQLEIIVGSTALGKYRVVLWDSSGRNSTEVGEGTTSDSVPDKFRIGSGPELAGKILTVQTVFASPGESATQVNVRYKLTGGPKEEIFSVATNLNGTAIVSSPPIRLVN